MRIKEIIIYNMEILREALITIKTNFENKGPYKLQISKRDLIVSTIKIRMKDDVTHVVSLSEGDFIIKILKSDKECLSAPMTLPNFENGSLIKIMANDTLIDVNTKEVIKYKTVDEFMDLIKDDDKKSKKTNKAKLKNTLVNNDNNKNSNNKSVLLNNSKVNSSNKNQVHVSVKEESKTKSNENEKKNENNNQSNQDNQDNQNRIVSDIDKNKDSFISREEFERTILELTNKYDNQIKDLTHKLERLQNTIEPSTNINIKLDDI